MYWDVERYDAELTMVLPLKNVRSLAAVLGFELGALLGIDSLPDIPRDGAKPRHLVLADARDQLGVSINKMAEEIGFDEAFVHRIEKDAHALETYPYDVLRIVANYLNLDPGYVLSTSFE